MSKKLILTFFAGILLGSGVERANSEMKDNYGANHVRVKGHLKVLCHLMFGVLVLTVKQIFNYFA